MKTKVILVGYDGSQKIVPASKYLTSKYLPKEFEVTYLNYTGEINGWARYLCGFLEYMTDENVIFALDDYLLAAPLEMDKYNAALKEMVDDVKCIKLCHSTKQEHVEYPCTTQYTIWNREFLIAILQGLTNPWSFEIDGSTFFKAADIKVLHRPCLEYFCNSSISGRWEGVRLDGLNEEDKKYIKENLL